MPRTITAKYPGKCLCGARIQRGEKIVYDHRVVGCSACGAVDGPMKTSNGFTIVSAWVLYDGSGAHALFRYNGFLFACSFSVGIHASIVHDRACSRSAPRGSVAKAEAAFCELVVDHFTPHWLALNAAMYADLYAERARAAQK